MRTRSASVAIAEKDLRRRFRDRTAILVAIILPVGLAWIFSLTLGGADRQSFTATYAVVDQDHGSLAASFTDTLTHLDFVTLRTVSGRARAERLAQDGDVDAAFVFPEGFSAGVTAGAGGRISVIASPSSDIGALVAASLARSFASRLNAVGVSIATVVHTGDARPGIAARAQQVSAAAVVRDARAADRTFSATTFFAIGMAVFFLFFTIEFGVRSLLEERQDGTLARLLVAPIGPGSILIGKALASFLIGLVSTSVMILVSTWLLHATWGNALGVAILVLAGVFTAVAVTALVATLAKTPGQAGSYASIVAVVGGLLGGTFFPISQAPGLLASMRFLSPQGWLMQGFEGLASGGSLAGSLPAIAGTIAIGVVCAAIAWSRAYRMVAR